MLQKKIGSNSVLGIRRPSSAVATPVDRKKTTAQTIYKLSGKIELRDAISCGLAPENNVNAFQIILPQDHDYIFETQFATEKNEWVDDLDKALAAIASKTGGFFFRKQSFCF